MSVLKDVEALMTKEEIEENEAQYQKETEHLRNPQIVRSGWFRVGNSFGYGPGTEFKTLEEAKAQSRYGDYAGIIRIDWLDNMDFIVTKELLK